MAGRIRSIFDIDQRKERTLRYIDNQPEHHRKMDFKTEFLSFLDAHEMEYDVRYVFD